MNSSNRGKSSNRGVARGGSIRGRGRKEDRTKSCGLCCKCTGNHPFVYRNWKSGKGYEISDDDFVENPYGYGMKKNNVDPNPPTSDDEFVPCTYTSKSSTSDDDFLPCTFAGKASTSSGVTEKKPHTEKKPRT